MADRLTPDGKPAAEAKHLKALHAAARARCPRMSSAEQHEFLRAACGVPSLSLSIEHPFLSRETALRVLRNWNDQRPEPRRRKRRSRLQPGVIRPMASGQFAFMCDRFFELNWKPDRIVHWLAERYQVKAECPPTPNGGFIIRITSAVDSRLARQINDALNGACKKLGRKDAAAHPHTEVPGRAPF